MNDGPNARPMQVDLRPKGVAKFGKSGDKGVAVGLFALSFEKDEFAEQKIDDRLVVMAKLAESRQVILGWNSRSSGPASALIDPQQLRNFDGRETRRLDRERIE